MKFDKGFKQFSLKSILFISLFILISLIIGQKIVGSSLLYGFKIFIYGGMGYILLFSMAGFILLYKERLLKLKSFRYKIEDFLFLLMSFIFVSIFYFLELNITKIEISLVNIILVQGLFLSIFICLLIGIYGLDFIRNFFRRFKKELLYFLVFGIVVYSLMYQVWKLWPYLSLFVLKITKFLLELFGSNVKIINADTLIVGNFSAKIGEACSGVYSIFIFTSLFLFIVLLDWKKLNKIKIALVFIPAVLGAFFANVLRVFLLFVFGAYVSRNVALGLYHSYIGMIFFLIYFALFWILFYERMKKDKYRIRESRLNKLFKKIMSDSLYRNSVYLMMSTFVMSVSGFFFWIINARLFTTEQVGLATTIISMMSLITGLSILGLNTGLIRYLPNAERKNNKINTSLTLVTLVTIVVTSMFLIGLDTFSPKLSFIKENIFFAFSFILFMIVSGFNSIVESVFIAYRDTKHILIKNSVFSVLKLIFPFLFVSLGAYWIFSSWMISLTLGLLVSFFVLVKKFDYKPKFVFYDAIIKKIGKYSFGNYLAGFIGGLPLMILPLMITHMINPETTAYYYMATMIVALLFIIPQATTQSLFAEGSYNEKYLKIQIKKAIKITFILMIPGIILTMFLGKYILLLFGKEYASEGVMFLQIMAMSGFFVGISSIFAALLRIKDKISEMIWINIVRFIVIIGLSYLLIDRGLTGLGIAWIIGLAVTTLLYYLWSLKK